MDASNNLISFYVYDGAGLVAKITPSNQYYFYHYDGLGSTIAITDSSGQVVNSYCYSPEGLVGAQETINNPFQYVGRFGVMAEGNGLYYMRARYYDPEVGRFINKDPIGYAGGINLFTYTGNNPVTGIDPEGLDVNIVIQRLKSNGYSTPGVINVSSTKVKTTFSGATLEPNMPINPRIPATPADTYYYAWKRTQSATGKPYKIPRIQLRKFPWGAQIHVGTTPFPDSLGCILVGLTGDADEVKHSRAAMKAILNIIRADATGNITVTINDYRMWFDPLFR
jgi:RHS repeat-associated protein